MNQRLPVIVALLVFLAMAGPLLCLPAQAAEKKAKERLAVLDLEAKYGIPKDFAEGLSVIVRDKIHSYGEFQVMSQDDIQAVASREQLKQALGCDDGSGQCLIDFGRQIGTRFMVAGSISKFGSTYTVSLRMLDTQGESAGVINRVSENCKCSEDDLIGTVQNVAASLVGKKTNEAAKKAAEEAKRLVEEKKKVEEAERQRQAAIAEEQRKVEAEKQKLAAETERLRKEKEKAASEAAAKKAEEEKQKLAAEAEKLKKEKERGVEAEQKRLAELLKKEDAAAQKKIAEKKEPQGSGTVTHLASPSRAGTISELQNDFRVDDSKIFRDACFIRDKTIPLPPGDWRIMGSGPDNDFYSISLIQEHPGKIFSYIVITVDSLELNRESGFLPWEALKRTDMHHIVSVKNLNGEAQNGWWINNFIPTFSSKEDKPLVKMNEAYILSHNLIIPNVVIKVAHRITGERPYKKRYLQVEYAYNPQGAGFPPAQKTSWKDSDWNALRVNEDPRKTEYIKELIKKHTLIHEKIKAGFHTN